VYGILYATPLGLETLPSLPTSSDVGSIIPRRWRSNQPLQISVITVISGEIPVYNAPAI